MGGANRDDVNGDSSKEVDVKSESKSSEAQQHGDGDEAARQQRRGGQQQEDNDQDGRMNHAVSLLQEKYR